MGNFSCTASGLGAGDASRKSLRGSTRTLQRRRASSSCCHYADTNRLIGDQHRAKVIRQEGGQITQNELSTRTALEDLLMGDCDDEHSSVDVDVPSYCVSPSTDDGYFGDHQMTTSLREDPDDGDEDMTMICKEDKAMMLLTTPTTICGEEWINWTALCPCCRRDASDDSIDLQEMIKLEPIRVVSAEMYERQIFGPGGKVGKCLGCFHMGVVVTLERPCRKSKETRYLIHKLRDFDDESEGVLTVARMSAVNVGKVWHRVPDTKKNVHCSTFLDFKNACGNEYRLFGNNCVHSVKRMMQLP